MNFSKLTNINQAIEYLNNKWHENQERFVIIEKFEGNLFKIGTTEDNEIEYIRFFDKNGEVHRNNGNPSIITKDVMMWHKNGRLHRTHGKPAVIRETPKIRRYYSYSHFQNILEEEKIGSYENGFPKEEYFIDGLRHRDYDLPAVVFNDKHSYWYLNGLMHRDNNKPAIINGNFFYYYKNGKKYKEEIYYGNKTVDWIMKNPIIILITIFTIITSITFF